MGYKRKAKTFDLVFTSKEDEEFDGLEIVMKGLSIKAYLKIASMADSAAVGGELGDLLHGFADALVSWNLEDDNGPVAADFDGVSAQDLDFIMKLITHWLKAAAGVGDELGKGSDSGVTSLEASMPMENL